MTGAGGNIGGGACSRSITDFATSAAERMPVAWVRAFAGRRGLMFFGALFGAFFVAFFGAFIGAFIGALLGGSFGGCFGAALGIFRAARTGCVADDLRTAGLSSSVAAGRGARFAEEVAAASTFRRACFAAFFSVLNNLRACLRCAFAARTWVFAAAARAAALVAATLSRLMNGDGVVI
jgi:predicted lipid-binding transport protein (Tim44 family)